MGKVALLSMAIESDESLDLDTRRMACLVGLSSRPSCEPLAPAITAERGTGLSDLFLASTCEENCCEGNPFNLGLRS